MKNNSIEEFRGEYFFLSNFYTGEKFSYQGLEFSNGESAFHSQKNIKNSKAYQSLSPSEAKRRGRKENLREDWEEVKDQIMFDIQLAKFSQSKELKEKLLATDNKTLVEGNWWHDNYWGSCQCSRCQNKGKNKLGEILMKVREQLKNEK